jgi:hypothetical protein
MSTKLNASLTFMDMDQSATDFHRNQEKDQSNDIDKLIFPGNYSTVSIYLITLAFRVGQCEAIRRISTLWPQYVQELL